MALNIWASANSANLTTLRSGVNVCIAVVTATVSGVTTTTLKWKREKGDGTWPTDAEAVPISVLTAKGTFTVFQMVDGRILIGDGASRFWVPKTTDPKTAADFQQIEVIS